MDEAGGVQGEGVVEITISSSQMKTYIFKNKVRTTIILVK